MFLFNFSVWSPYYVYVKNISLNAISSSLPNYCVIGYGSIGNSSAASNINTKDTSEEIKKRNFSDVGSEFRESIKANDSGKLKCKLCGHMCSGGVY